MSYVDIANAIGFVTFTGAVGALLLVPGGREGRFTTQTKGFMIAAYGMYVLSLGIDMVNVVAQAGAFLEEIENFVDVLFPIFILMAVISAYSAQQLMDLRSAQHSMRASHDMLFGIVETAPAGIMVLDPSGRITFANETARSILDLSEDSATGDIETPGWTVTDHEGRGRPDFRVLSQLTGLTGSRKLAIQWPSGWRVDLDVYTEPLGDGNGIAGGLVATFERPHPGTRT